MACCCGPFESAAEWRRPIDLPGSGVAGRPTISGKTPITRGTVQRLSDGVIGQDLHAELGAALVVASSGNCHLRGG
jgi:hypothetical protein